jgi:hypothetical protein
MISGFDQGASNWKLGIKNYILGIFGQDQNIERTWILICIYRITDTNAQKWFAVNFIPLIKLKVNIETHLVTFCIFKKFLKIIFLTKANLDSTLQVLKIFVVGKVGTSPYHDSPTPVCDSAFHMCICWGSRSRHTWSLWSHVTVTHVTYVTYTQRMVWPALCMNCKDLSTTVQIKNIDSLSRNV